MRFPIACRIPARSRSITNAQGLAKLAEIRKDIPALKFVISIDGASDGALDFNAAIAKASSDFTPEPTTPDTPAMMIYTSGTTGQPKGALHGHRVLPGHLPGVEMPHDFFPQAGDRFWTPADWAWAGGLLDALLPSLASRRRRWWRANSTSSIRKTPMR